MLAELGRYRLLDKLGQGGMATVYRARDPQLGRDVAIKVMHPFIAERSEAAVRFEREARAVAGLHHPNVMQLHDYQPAEGERPAYLVMELLTGPSLRAFLDQHGTPFAEVGAIIGLRVAQALEAAHARGIVHRDVKPENVMFDGHRVVLGDFGIARLSLEGHTMTATGAVIGSPLFMSPEQACGEPVDARSDLFSLGSLLYLLSAGTAPFAGGQPMAIMNKISKGVHSPPTARNPRVPRWLERAVERCLQVAPADRFQSAGALVEALGDGLRGDGLGDFDGELQSYLRELPVYNERFPARIIESSLSQLRQAVQKQQRARALSSASRILAWEPGHAEALSVVDKLDRPRRRLRILAAGAGLLLSLGLGAGGLALVRHRQSERRPAPLPLGPLTEVAPLVEAKPVVVAPAPSPALAQLPGKRRHPSPRIENENQNENQNRIENESKNENPRRIENENRNENPTEKTAQQAPEPPAWGELTVAITPWCDLTVDGKERGRAPLTLRLPAGPHHVECRQPSGAQVTRDVTLTPGKTEVLREGLFAAARIAPHLSPEVQFALDDGAPTSGARAATAGRHRVTLYRNGKAGEARWLDVRPEGCRLVDTPELACEKP